MRARGAHPETRAIAEYQAGADTGLAFWRARRIAAHLKSCERCQQVAQQLSLVSRTLAAAPPPSMPPHVAERLSAALRAEQATRAAPTGTHAPRREAALRAATPRRLRPALLMPVAAGVVLVAIAGTTTLLLQHSPSPTSTASGSLPNQATTPKHQAGVNPADSATPRPTMGRGQMGIARYQVESSGTDYRAATLQSQASALLHRAQGVMAGETPSSALRDCVALVTAGSNSGVRVVDRATYQERPAYIIVSGAKVWVTGLGCSGSNPDLITSAGLPAGR